MLVPFRWDQSYELDKGTQIEIQWNLLEKFEVKKERYKRATLLQLTKTTRNFLYETVTGNSTSSRPHVSKNFGSSQVGSWNDTNKDTKISIRWNFLGKFERENLRDSWVNFVPCYGSVSRGPRVSPLRPPPWSPLSATAGDGRAVRYKTTRKCVRGVVVKRATKRVRNQESVLRISFEFGVGSVRSRQVRCLVICFPRIWTYLRTGWSFWWWATFQFFFTGLPAVFLAFAVTFWTCSLFQCLFEQWIV